MINTIPTLQTGQGEIRNYPRGTVYQQGRFLQGMGFDSLENALSLQGILPVRSLNPVLCPTSNAADSLVPGMPHDNMRGYSNLNPDAAIYQPCHHAVFLYKQNTIES